MFSLKEENDHEGTVEVHSEGENRGSRFRVRLPLRPD
jgi:signal transduction histidine kinase